MIWRVLQKKTTGIKASFNVSLRLFPIHTRLLLSLPSLFLEESNADTNALSGGKFVILLYYARADGYLSCSYGY